jgi:transposase InsO family protein
VSAHQAEFPITTMCRVLGLSTSGYYAWRGRGVSRREREDAVLLDRIRHFHAASKGRYGARKIQADLAEEGRHVGCKRVARLMRADGLVGVMRRRWTVTTRRNGHARAAPDRVDRDFTTDRPDQLWVADITYVPTWAGFVHLAVVLDVFSRRIVGWSMAGHLRTKLVLDALDMAIGARQPSGVIHHSDQGCQYTALEFGDQCRRAGIVPSMGSVGDCYDNAMAESFFATLECELLTQSRFRDHAEARRALFEFIEGWYNPRRRHQSLGQVAPVQFEKRYAEVPSNPNPELSTEAG